MKRRKPIVIFRKSYPVHQRRKWQGMDISIETPHGDVRHWKDDATGETGHTAMHNDYGYLRETGAHDGDHVDVFIGPFPDTAENVYVVRQMKAPTFTRYDEDKCMVGFNSEGEAEAAYRSHYNKAGFFGWIDTFPVAEFLAEVKNTHKAPQPVGGYGMVEDWLHPDDKTKLAKSQGLAVGTVRDWKGGKYQKQPNGDWTIVAGGSDVHAPTLIAGHKVEKGGEGHELAHVAGAGSHGKAIGTMLPGAIMRVGFGGQQATYRKAASGWERSFPPGKPWSPMDDASVVADVDHRVQQTGQPAILVTEHAKSDIPAALTNPPAELPAFERTVRQAEATMINHPHERGLAFDENGKVIFHREGTRGSIRFEPKQLAAISGRVFTHNHPDTGGSFSPADVSLAMGVNLREIRAVSHNSGEAGSGRYVHRMIRPNGGWQELEPKIDQALEMMFGQKVSKAPLPNKLNVLAKALMQQEQVKGAAPGMDPDVAHRAWQRFAKLTGARYYRNDLD